MGIRESIENNRGLSAGVAAGLVVAAIGLVFWTNSSGMPGPQQKAFYSNNDGQTWFVDDLNKPFPFDKDGKLAYRAYVYKCSDGRPFVAYLQRLTDGGKAKMAELAGKPMAEVGGQMAELLTVNSEVKKPGDSKWVPPTSGAGTEATTPKCAGAGGSPEAVYP